MLPESFHIAVENGTSRGEWSELASWLSERSSFTFASGYNANAGPFDEQIFRGLLPLFEQPSFLCAKEAADVLLVFEFDWSQLTAGQRSDLMRALVRSYGNFVDFLPRFVISELLGEYYTDKEGLDSLIHLKRSVSGPRRSLLPMGFELIVRKCPDRSIAQRAYDEMKGMADEPYEAVRGEVAESLSRIASDDPHGLYKWS